MTVSVYERLEFDFKEEVVSAVVTDNKGNKMVVEPFLYHPLSLFTTLRVLKALYPRAICTKKSVSP